jgi:predicted metalloprotease with PDZ domain
VTTRLRSEERSLDDAMRELFACCARSSRRWSADEIFTRLDRAAPSSSSLAALSDRELDRPGFVAVEPTLERLGIRVQDKRALLSKRGPSAALRRSLLRP